MNFLLCVAGHHGDSEAAGHEQGFTHSVKDTCFDNLLSLSVLKSVWTS